MGKTSVESLETMIETAYTTLVIRSQNSRTEDGVNVTSFHPLPCYCFKILFKNKIFLTQNLSAFWSDTKKNRLGGGFVSLKQKCSKLEWQPPGGALWRLEFHRASSEVFSIYSLLQNSFAISVLKKEYVFALKLEHSDSLAFIVFKSKPCFSLNLNFYIFRDKIGFSQILNL